VDRPPYDYAESMTLVVAERICADNGTGVQDLLGDALAMCDGALRIVLLHAHVTDATVRVLLQAEREAVDLGVELTVSVRGPLALAALRAAGADRLLEAAHDAAGRGAPHLIPPV
jgi:hypothetical protein